ncbi:dTMP kinase [Albimonas sp. CAU 1670]|uniref:dTMP kinase n=1 Tax=Albimonas sp. CAU 1670 TaxID=3032599 RepID=UPI0023DC5229|nr:dTMP kinase [Albimonas sp. CAU 1670]MDF2233037.1 dTMP kinase [Albimonas sp. CAU 1670]
MTRQTPAGPGLFVSVEGGDGAGKSTQLRRLAEALRAEGRDVVVTREPGGAPGAEEIRRLVLEGEPGRWSPVSELLLFNAARRDHVERTILPALARGAVVLCDRFADSTRVYQGAAREAAAQAAGQGGSAGRTGLPEPDLAMADALHALVIGIEPDLTLIFDIDPEVGLGRGVARGGEELRFERLGLEFHAQVRARFRALAERFPQRCRIIDASGEPDAVFARVRAALADRLAPA